MAASPTHRFGQIIGDLLEVATVERVRPIVEQHNMYLDYNHPRPARGNEKIIHMKDSDGNVHDLDLVVEENGSEEKMGKPRAFIEVAWRRYTKHSKNKVQEISSAVLACAKRFENDAPFMGTVLAGEFTKNSLDQLASQGFVVVHFPLEAIVDAFAVAGINAYWKEDTPDDVVEKQVIKYDHLPQDKINAIKHRLFDLEKNNFNQFVQVLDGSLERRVKVVKVSSLWGVFQSFATIEDAREYIQHVKIEGDPKAKFARFEVEVIYTDGSRTSMVFINKNEALQRLALMEH